MENEELPHNKLSFIFGKRMKSQARLLRRARAEAHKWRKITLSWVHYRYLLQFGREHLFLITGLSVLLFSQGFIEAILIMFSRDYASANTRAWFFHHFWMVFVSLITIFLVNVYFSLKYERSLVVLLTNSIRRRLFGAYINRAHTHSTSETKADIIAKISYHLPLVSMGVSNVFFGVCRWLIYFALVVGIASMGGFHIGVISMCYVGISIVIAGGAYVISRYYASQEVTFYSRIIREVEMNASNIDFVKVFGQEQSVLKKFDSLVWFDSFFRVRRDIFMRIGASMVFILLVVVSVISHFLPNGFLSFIGSISIANRFLIIFLLMYFSRAFSEALKVGLYIFPARLGLFLTIVSSGNTATKADIPLARDECVTFHWYKTKLHKEGPYYKNAHFVFKPGERVLFYGDTMSGKTSLARIFAGIAAYTPRAIVVTIGTKRHDFSQWKRLSSRVYFFDPNFRTDRSLMECILGKIKDDISMEEFAQALDIINQYPAVAALVTSEGNYNASAHTILSNPVQACALHTLHVLVTRPHIIIIDNMWIDLEYRAIQDMVRILDMACSDTILIVYSHSRNELIAYTQYYELADKIKQIV